MRKLIRTFEALVVCAVVAAVAATPLGQARTADTVTCSSKTPTNVNLTGTWVANDGTYRIRQVGTCVWWAATTNAFFGTLSSSGSTVFGLWAGLDAAGRSGSVILVVRSTRSLARRASTGGFVAASWKKSR